MHIDARTLENNSLIEGDICIIGAGTAGISIALDWITTPYQVVLLEGGGFEYEQKMQDLYRGNITGRKYYPLHITRLHHFGGTTGHWAGMCSPLDNIDFIKRGWVPNSGWPISKVDLDSFYVRAHDILKLGPYQYELDFWQKQLPNLYPFPLNGDVIWHKLWQFSHARFAVMYKDAIVEARNIHLYTYANAVNIKANENVSKISEVFVRNHAGRTHSVRAKYFILACGAIQNARLLLASNKQAKGGLGNDYDVLGRYFMEHIEMATAEMWLLKPFATHLYSGANNIRAELAIQETIQKEEEVLNGTLSLIPLSTAKHLKPKMEVLQEPDYNKATNKFAKNWEEAAKKAQLESSQNISRAFGLQIRIEQAPNAASRITIGPEVDELGVPVTNLHWDLTQLDKRSIRKINQIIGRQVGLADFARVKLKEFLWDENDYSWPEGTSAGWHHMGTTRMADDTSNGVVNSHCRVQGIAKIFFSGSGCFPTSGAANPTLTLLALSLRLSDYIKDQL